METATPVGRTEAQLYCWKSPREDGLLGQVSESLWGTSYLTNGEFRFLFCGKDSSFSLIAIYFVSLGNLLGIAMKINQSIEPLAVSRVLRSWF